MRRKHGLRKALNEACKQAAIQSSYKSVPTAFTDLLGAGTRAGTVREDADPRGHAPQFTAAFWRAAPDRSKPMLALLLAGLTAE